MITEQVRVRPPVVRLPLWFVVVEWLTRRLWRALRLAVRTPAWFVLIMVGVVAGLAWQVTPPLAVSFAMFLVLASCFWRINFPDAWELHVARRLRSAWFGTFRYRLRWGRTLRRSGILLRGQPPPLLLSIICDGFVDRLRLRMLEGQQPADYASKSERLGQTFRALECRTRTVEGRPQELELWLLIRDPLRKPLRPFPPGGPLPAEGLPLAKREDGSVWRWQYTHLLVAGQTQSGKSGALWALIFELAPAVWAGLAQLWVIDNKGGVEMAPGRHLFYRFARGDMALATLERAVAVMKRRQARMFDVTRGHVSSKAEPLIVVIIDELAAITAYTVDAKTKRRVNAALGMLRSQGLNCGAVVVGALQDPRKDMDSDRSLFTTRVAFKLAEAAEVPLVLGPGARDMGARCDLIDENLPGVAYVRTEGKGEVDRVRFIHVTDRMVWALGRSQALPEFRAPTEADDQPRKTIDPPRLTTLPLSHQPQPASTAAEDPNPPAQPTPQQQPTSHATLSPQGPASQQQAEVDS